MDSDADKVIVGTKPVWQQQVNWWMRRTPDVLEAIADWCTGLVVPTSHPGDKTVRNKAYIERWYTQLWKDFWEAQAKWNGEFIAMQKVLPIYASPWWYSRRTNDPTNHMFWEKIKRKRNKLIDGLVKAKGIATVAVYLENHSPIWTELDAVAVVRAMVQSGISWQIGHPWSSYRRRYTLSCEFTCAEWWGSHYGPNSSPPKIGSRNTQTIALADDIPNPNGFFTARGQAEYILAARKRGENVTVFPNGYAPNERGERKHQILVEQYIRLAKQIGEWLKKLDPDAATDPDIEPPSMLSGIGIVKPEIVYT